MLSASKPPFGAQLNTAHRLAFGLVGAWLFNERSGVYVLDATGRQRPGLLTSASRSANRAGVGLNWAKTAGQKAVLRSIGPIIGGRTNWTIIATGSFPSGDSTTNGRAFYSERGSSGNDILKLDSQTSSTGGGNCWNLTYRNDGGTLLQMAGTGFAAADGVYRPVAIIKQGTSFKIAVHGLVTDSATFGSSSDAFTDASVECWAAADKGDSGSLFNGFMGHLFLYDRALPIEQVAQMAAEPYEMFVVPSRTRFFFIPPSQVIAPGGIASAEAFGSAKVAGPIIVGGIASAEAFGAALLIGAPQTVIPGGIFEEAFGIPKVAGPIIVGGIASAEAFGTALVNLVQKVLPGGIASAEAFGTPYVSNVQSIRPGGIASAEAFGTPVVAAGPQGIIPSGIYEGAVGTPAVLGGAQDLQLFVGTFPRIRWLKSAGMRLQSQTRGRWTAYFEAENIMDGDLSTVDTTEEWRPLIGQTVIIREYQKWFMGCLTEVEQVRSNNTDLVTYRCTAADKTSICDRRVVPPQTFTADQDAADVIRLVVAQSLFGEGITVTEIPVSLGPLGSDLIPNYWYVTQVFDTIADLIGMQWYVDVDGRLIWVEPDLADPAPFNISEISVNYRDIVVKNTLTEYRNKQWVVSNRNILPGDGTGPQQAPALSETITLPQQEAVDRGFTFGSLVLPMAILSVVTFKVNGVDTPIYEVTGATFGTLPDLNTVWWFFPGAPYITAPNTPAPNPGDIIDITYIPYSNQGAAGADDPLTVVVPSIPIPGELYGTCGTGIFEHVQYVNDITNQNDLLAIAQGLLDRSGIVPVIVDFETDYPGLYVGMKLNGDIARLGLDNVDLFITGLTGQAQARDLGHGSCFRWRVTAMNIKDVSRWTKWFERLLRRSQHALPVSVATAATFIFAPGTSLSGGTSVENPHPVLASGRLYEIVVMTDNPPTDQDLHIDITRNGTSILDPANPLIVPDGDDTTVRLTDFASTALFLLKDDRLRATATYRSTGPDPVNARSVTVQVRVAV